MKILIVGWILIRSLVGIDPYADVHRSLDGRGIPKSDAKIVREIKTPAGAKVYTVVKDVPKEFLASLDAGAQQAIDRKLPAWDQIKSPKEMRWILVEPSTFRDTPRVGQKCTNLETEPGSPCLLVKGVQTAGTVIGVGQFDALKLSKSLIVLPHQKAQNWRYLKYAQMSGWFEGEHFVECNQREGRSSGHCLYYQVVNDVHPHRANPGDPGEVQPTGPPVSP